MLTIEERRLVDYLKKYAFGKDNAVKRSQIIEDLRIPDRDLRDLKGRIVREFGIPIGSTNKGYWFASNDLEIMQFRNYHNSLMMEHRETMLSYEEMVINKNQMSML